MKNKMLSYIICLKYLDLYIIFLLSLYLPYFLSEISIGIIGITLSATILFFIILIIRIFLSKKIIKKLYIKF